MKCGKYQDQIVLYLYRELDPAERRDLERHLGECSACARDLAYTREVFGLIDQAEADVIPEARWDSCWTRIVQGIQSPPRSRRSWAGVPRWAPIAAAVLLIFAAGIFLGRFWPNSRPPAEPDTASAAGFSSITLQDYFASLQPVLAEYANQPAESVGDDRIVVDRSLIHSLLVQNFMLMRLAAQNDPEAVDLLEDIDLVLREIKNLDGSDPEAPAMIRRLIYQRDILFKMNLIQTL
jgi:hypothetical protein